MLPHQQEKHLLQILDQIIHRRDQIAAHQQWEVQVRQDLLLEVLREVHQEALVEEEVEKNRNAIF